MRFFWLLSPRVLILATTLLILLLSALFIVADRGATLRITAVTNHLTIEVNRPADFSFQTKAGWVRMPGATSGLKKVRGALVLGGKTTLTIIRNPEDSQLRIVFEVASNVPLPQIGNLTIPTGTILTFDAAEQRDIAVLLATGGLSMGGQARSNGTAYLESADYEFIERVWGVGDVTTLAGKRGRFDRLHPVDAATGAKLPMDTMIDLTGTKMTVWAEGGGADFDAVLTVTQPVSGKTFPLTPSSIDRLLANPLSNLIPGLLTILLIVGQIIVMVPVVQSRRRKAPAKS